MKTNTNVKPIIKKTKNFETIKICLLFPWKYKKENIANNCILPYMLRYMCEKYDTEEKFNKAKLKLQILSLEVFYESIGDEGAFCFSLIIPDSKYLNNKQIQDTIDFLSEIVYHPKVIDKGFDQFELEREINNLQTSISNTKKNLRGYINYIMPTLLDEKGICKRGIVYHMNLIDKLTPQSLYKVYQKTIQSKSPYCFVIGNVDKKMISSYLEEKFLNKEQIKYGNNFDHFLTPKSKPNIVIKEKDFKQSAVCLAFKVKDYDKKDKIGLQLINSLLRYPSTNLLFNKLRSEEGLVYETTSTIHSRFGTLQLKAFTSREKLEYTKDKMLEVINDLKNEKLVTTLLNAINEDYRIALLEDKDSLGFTLDCIIDKYLGIMDYPEEIYKQRLKYSAKDISQLVSRLQVDTILYVKEKK